MAQSRWDLTSKPQFAQKAPKGNPTSNANALPGRFKFLGGFTLSSGSPGPNLKAWRPLANAKCANGIEIYPFGRQLCQESPKRKLYFDGESFTESLKVSEWKLALQWESRWESRWLKARWEFRCGAIALRSHVGAPTCSESV